MMPGMISRCTLMPCSRRYSMVPSVEPASTTIISSYQLREIRGSTARRPSISFRVAMKIVTVSRLVPPDDGLEADFCIVKGVGSCGEDHLAGSEAIQDESRR